MTPTSWAGRRVFVTGCTGFLGGWVVRELAAAGAEVVGLVRDRVPDSDFLRDRLFESVLAVRGRVEDLGRVHSAMAVREVCAVFHLAADPHAAPDRGTDAVFEAVRRYDSRVPVVTARPDAAPAPTEAGLRVGVARFGEVFGGGDRRTFRAVPAAAVGLLTGDRTPHAFDSTPARDFVYARDAARALVVLADSLLGRADPGVAEVAFRTGWSFTDAEMGRAVADVYAGRPGGTTTAPPPNPLGWAPSCGLAGALTETLDWYRTFLRTRFFGTKPAPTRTAA